MPDVIFNGPAGRIEGRFNPGPTKTAPIALILHPDPKNGGTMNNKIVHSLYRSFSDLDFATFRFNFRGVGRSEGSHDNGEGELSDAAAALDWLQSTYPQASHFWVAGFSIIQSPSPGSIQMVSESCRVSGSKLSCNPLKS